MTPEPVSPPPEGTPEREWWDAVARSSSDEGTRRERAPKTRRRRRRQGVSTYGTSLMSPSDMERYLRGGPATGWTEASQDTVDWLLAERDRTVVLRSPDGKTTMRVQRDTDEHRTYLEDGWR